MNKTFILTIIICLLTQNVMGILFNTGRYSCPCNTTAFEEDYYQATTMDFSALAGVASNLVIVGVVAQILLILPLCPNFCLTRYAAKAGPPINKGIQKAADAAARLNARLAAKNVKDSTCKYNYPLLLLSCLPGNTVHMTECANNARIAATEYAMKALRDECPKLNTDIIETALTALLTVAFAPLVTIAIAETAKNLLLGLPCGSWQILPGLDLPPLPGLGEFSSLPIVPDVLGLLGGILG